MNLHVTFWHKIRNKEKLTQKKPMFNLNPTPMKKFKQSIWLLSAIMLGHASTNAQLSIPDPEDVYGGRINSICLIKTGTDSSRIFISTESANSLFYTDVYAPSGSMPVYNQFQVLPGADAMAGYGAYINSIAAHEESGNVYFSDANNLYATHPSSSTVTLVNNTVQSFIINGSDLILSTMAQEFAWGTLDATGTFTENTNSPISMPPIGQVKVSLGVDGYIYLFSEGTVPKVYKSSDPYTSFSSTTTFNDISPTTLTVGYNWVAFGMAPDNSLFLGGTDNSTKFVAQSTDGGATWTEINTGSVGIAGGNISFSGNASDYYVYLGSTYSDSVGALGTWQKLGDIGGFETHPNDGAVIVDPNNIDVIYLTTDQGIGSSYSRGEGIYEINDGVEAVQVKDFDMTSDKNTAWLASKSGIRMVTNYQTTPVWSNALFPNSDGSPYYSCAMETGNANTAYVGNARVYKTTDAGTSWTRMFSAEDAPYMFASVGVNVKAIEVCEYNTNIVFVGYHADGTDKGGLFYSEDAGANWNQLLIEAGSMGEDVDVQDIIFNKEGSDTVAYIGVEYDLADPQGTSVYRIVKSGSSWVPSQNFDGTHTTVGYQITATIMDLHKSATGDTLFACGTDAGVNEPHVYVKILSGTGLWEPITTSGYGAGTNGKAITLGKDTMYCAVDNEIYYMAAGGTAWSLGYTYPEGNEINFLYYDELLVGAGTGLYAQNVSSTVSSIKKSMEYDENFRIYPNPISKAATISYTINSEEHVSLKLLDVTGREIEIMVNDNKAAGTYKVHFDAAKIAKGMYVVKLQAGSSVSVQNIVIE